MQSSELPSTFDPDTPAGRRHSIILLPAVLLLLCLLQKALAAGSLEDPAARLVKPELYTEGIASGDKQVQVAESWLESPLQARILDARGEPLPGRAVHFRVASTPSKAQGAELERERVLSDERGIARTRVRLGDRAGEYVFSARVPGSEIDQGQLFFKATARHADWVFLLAMGLVGGLALFLFGMEMMSEGMKKAAGNRMRSILGKLTGHRIVGLMVGAFVTMVIQSSSATTVMLVSFVQAQLMTFVQSLGVVLGADIGTTITAQLIAFKLTDFALLMIAAGFALNLFARGSTFKHVGQAVLGFGILFYGMHLMSQAMYPLRSHSGFIQLLLQLENPLLGILVGALFTALIQSSSAFTGIIIVLAQQGLLSLEAGIPLILGANIGTCITAGLASLNTGREAKRVALAHTLFKVAGVLLFVFWIPSLAGLIRSLSPQAEAGLSQIAAQALVVPRQVANAHTVFNVSLALAFLPFTALFARLILWILPDRPVPDAERIIVWHLKDSRLSSPALALELARAEIQRMFKIVHRMLEAVIVPLVDPGEYRDSYLTELSLVQGLDLRERKVDFLDEKITAYLARISRESLAEGQAAEVFGMLSIVKDLESMGDIIHRSLLPLVEKKRRLGADFSAVGRQELVSYHVKTIKQMARLRQSYDNMDRGRARRVVEKETQYRYLEEEFRQSHFHRISEDLSQSVATHEIHLEIMDLLKQINLHQGNIGQTILTSVSWEETGTEFRVGHEEELRPGDPPATWV